MSTIIKYKDIIKTVGIIALIWISYPYIEILGKSIWTIGRMVGTATRIGC